eukprot:TRINITY_DN1791_c0_g2_i4.p1 TRINITY_DN1791_c0_g2~~TRINITY_DN1791_c0_g2_i4.p1  ORF type:complete len:581 (+),score=123.93 TRINITY_DN1791_c0_g2_i4:83-1825(+)
MDQFLFDQNVALTLQLTSSHHVGVRVFLKRTHCPLNDPNQVLVHKSEMAMISFSTESCPFEVLTIVESDKRIRKDVVTQITLCDAITGAIIDHGLRLAETDEHVSCISFSGLKRRMQSAKFGLQKTSFLSESQIRPMKLHVSLSVDGMDNSECTLQTPSFFVFSKIPTDVHLKDYVVRHLRADRASWISFHIDKTSKRYHHDQKRATIFLSLKKTYEPALFTLLQSLLPYTITPQQQAFTHNHAGRGTTRNATELQEKSASDIKRLCIREERKQSYLANQLDLSADIQAESHRVYELEKGETVPTIPDRISHSHACNTNGSEIISQAACGSEECIDHTYHYKPAHMIENSNSDNEFDADAETETFVCQDEKPTCGKDDANLLLSLASSCTLATAKRVGHEHRKSAQRASTKSSSDLILPSFAQSFASLIESEVHSHSSPNDEARSSTRSNLALSSEKTLSSNASGESRECDHHHYPHASFAATSNTFLYPNTNANEGQHRQHHFNSITGYQPHGSILVPSILSAADCSSYYDPNSKAQVWMKPIQFSDLLSSFHSSISLVTPVMIQIPHSHGASSINHHQ